MRQRIVVDTNVFVSGIFWSGPPYQILTAWRDRIIELVLSQAILEEYIRIALELSNRFPDIDLFPFIELLIRETKFCMPKRLAQPVCKDPDDDKFLECAIAGDAKCIISGDRHLLEVSGYEGIQILRPKDYVNIYLNKR